MFSDVNELYQSLILGLVQGLTEFLPVSSSGHLVILPTLLEWPQPTLLSAVVVHLGTLFSVCWVFRRDLREMAQDMLRTLVAKRWASYGAREGYFICLSAIPAAVAGVYLRPLLAIAMSSPLTAAYGLCTTAFLLFGGELVAHLRGRYRYFEEQNWLDALLMGMGQALALVPGISRSGATMAVGRALTLERPGVARFSFLMGIPIMVGAGLLELRDTLATGSFEWAAIGFPLVISFLASTLSGILAVRFLMSFVRKRGLLPFAVYCLALGLGLLYVLQSGSLRVP